MFFVCLIITMFLIYKQNETVQLITSSARKKCSL